MALSAAACVGIYRRLHTSVGKTMVNAKFVVIEYPRSFNRDEAAAARDDTRDACVRVEAWRYERVDEG